MKPFLVLIADDHALFRQGLKKILEEVFRGVMAEEASNGAQVLEMAAVRRYDIVLLDISMPGMNGLDTLKELKRLDPAAKVLVISMYAEEQYAVRAIKAGASGYLTKGEAPEELIGAVRSIVQAGTHITKSVAEKLAAEVSQRAKRGSGDLSDREHVIFNLLGEGKSAREIAEMMCLSIKTVNTYCSRLMKKMSVKGSKELLRIALRSDLERKIAP